MHGFTSPKDNGDIEHPPVIRRSLVHDVHRNVNEHIPSVALGP